ncbi:SDR family oxidoreductase [Flavobacterium sp. MDT1-60]|uniref:SDR family oxidoreductase n=1 Tax=Flavobacterium sp. MDT1-60 TaxID=1979344 RepID=UPI00178385FF|nr:NAD(P)H-binding protein [Flavobacterium sp. MDT1-60]QOG00938.1 NAD(P)H-binding protein [Flavobacterium sp. MDT1-60]
MRITILGSLGNIGKPLTELLVNGNHEVTVISSSEDRKTEIENLGAKAAIGTINDIDFLTGVFKQSDAVFTMTPPNMGGSDIIKNTTNAGGIIAKAISNSGIKRVVMLSSIGADSPVDNGPIKSLYNIEQLFNELQDVSVTILRAGYFYTNLYGNIPMIKEMGIIGGNYPGSAAIALVHPKDIAVAVANDIIKVGTQNSIQYIVSDYRTADDIAEVLGKAIEKSDLKWVEFTDEQSLQGMQQAGLPEEIAGIFTEMGLGIRTGVLQKDFLDKKSPIAGNTKLEDFAKEFALSY